MVARPHPPARLVAACLGERARLARDIAWLNDRDPTKNLMVAFRFEDRPLVLKVYRHRLRYTLLVLKNPVDRYLTRAFKLHSTATRRVDAEVSSIAAFGAAGLATFDLVERPAPAALVFHRYEGTHLARHLRDLGDPRATRQLLRRFTDEFVQRQALASRTRNRHLVHPDPCPKHVWVTPDGDWRYFDFEGRVNPSLGIDEALAREAESFLFHLDRLETSSRDDMDYAVARMEGEALERLRDLSRRAAWTPSKTNRRRSQAVATWIR